VLLLSTAASAAAPLQARDFLANPIAAGACLSPDGTYAAVITTRESQGVIIVWDLDADQKTAILRFPEPDAQLQWLEWANEKRLLFAADIPLPWSVGVRARGTLLYAIDRDGGNLTHLGAKWFGRGAAHKGRSRQADLIDYPIQFEDQVVSFLPGAK